MRADQSEQTEYLGGSGLKETEISTDYFGQRGNTELLNWTVSHKACKPILVVTQNEMIYMKMCTICLFQDQSSGMLRRKHKRFMCELKSLLEGHAHMCLIYGWENKTKVFHLCLLTNIKLYICQSAR